MVDTAPARTDLWQVLTGRAVGTPLAPDDPDVWELVTTRLNVARARPRLRDGIEAVAHVTVRGQPYVMLRSPDRQASYVRLAPEEWDLARQMDGSRSVAALVGVLARATGSLSPDRVTRVVADLAANRMLDELPVNAFAGVRRIKSGGRRTRLRRRLLDAARGRRMVLGDVDALVGVLYRAGGRLLFTRAAAIVAALLSLVGGLLFLRAWAGGTTSLFLQSGSYATGGLILLALNVVALLAHELGHALATKHAGRRVPAVGVLLYFGIPSAFVDTTDIWMASRKHRLIATAAGPASALTLAGIMQIVAFVSPDLAPLAFKLSFAWYLNALFNLNPLMALDGYYLAMDALEISNLRARGIAFLVGAVRTRRVRWASLDRESRYVAAYGIAAALWTVVFVSVSTRIWRDRLSGLVAGLWHTGIGGKVLVLLFVVGLFAPILSGLGGVVSRRLARRRALRETVRGATARLDALRASRLATLPAPALDRLAAAASWVPLTGARPVLSAGVLPSAVLVVAAGDLEARRPGDPPATVRLRAGVGDVIGVAEVTAGRATSLEWRTTGDARLLGVPAGPFREATDGLLAPPGVDVHAAEAALDASPVLAALAPQARGELLSRMASVDVPPGKVVTVADPEHAVLVGAGVLATADGVETRAGDVLRAEADDRPVRATTRTRATLWRLPSFGSLGASAFAAASVAPAAGAHGGGGHPPVTQPPAPVPGGDDAADDRLWRRTRRLLALLLLLALLSICGALVDLAPWSEVPGDRVLVVVTRGSAEMVVDGETVRLSRRGRVTLGAGDRVEVHRRSTVHLVYAGGAEQVLCGGSAATVLSVSKSRSERTFAASGGLLLERGALLADTESATSAYDPLELRVESVRLRAEAATGEPARFGVTVGRVDVRSGDVTVAGDAADGTVDCRGANDDDGGVLLPDPSPTPSSSPSPSASTPATPSASLSASPTGGATATAPPTSAAPTTAPPTTAPPTSAPTTVAPTPTPTVVPTPTPTVQPPGDIRWTCTPRSFTVQAGGAGSSRCTATSVDGYAGGVTFSCLDEPNGMTCDPAPASATLTPGSSASTTFTVSAGSATPPGTYAIRAVVTSADGTIVRSVTLRVTVS